MTLTDAPTAVIAEDEPVLARTLRRLLEQVWPVLVARRAQDGVHIDHQATVNLDEVG